MGCMDGLEAYFKLVCVGVVGGALLVGFGAGVLVGRWHAKRPKKIQLPNSRWH